MSKTEANSGGAEKKLTVDSLQLTVPEKKQGKGLNTEGAERTEKRPESGDQKSEEASLPAAAFEDSKHHIKIYQGDCLDILAKIPEDTVDLVFADPPYFLSNGGITCHAGRMVSVNKGKWDKSRGAT